MTEKVSARSHAAALDSAPSTAFMVSNERKYKAYTRAGAEIIANK